MPDFIKVGRWLVDPVSREISSGSVSKKLQPIHIKLLYYFAYNHNVILTKDAILDEVWPKRYVVDSVVRRCVGELRRLLEDDSKEPKYIETITNNGYRLIALVEHLDDHMGGVIKKAIKSFDDRKPYRGLQSFTLEDEDWFFGRERAISEALNALQQQVQFRRAFLLILGMSGIGKSSLVQAGILPRLIEQHADNNSQETRWSIFRYSDNCTHDIFYCLAAALLQVTALPELVTCNLDRTMLTRLFRDFDHLAFDVFESVTAQAGLEPGKTRLLLVIDQLEEIFTFQNVTPVHREKFIDILDCLSRSDWVWVIASMRSDFYMRCLELPKLIDLKQGYGQYDLLSPSPLEIQNIIKAPAEMMGLQFEFNHETGVALDETLLEGMQQYPESLPLLEFTLAELYERRSENNVLTYTAYKELGGIVGCLVERAEATFTTLRQEEKDQLPNLFSALIRINEGISSQPSITPVSKSDLLYSPAMQELVNAYIDARLLVSTMNANHDLRIRFAHEALIQYWPRLSAWIIQNREHILVHQRITKAALYWEAERRKTELLLPPGKPLNEAKEITSGQRVLNELELAYIQESVKRETKGRRIKQSVMTLLAILVLFVVTGAYFVNQQRQYAQAASELAQIESDTSHEVIEFLIGLFEAADPELSRTGDTTAEEILQQGVERIDSELLERPGIRHRVQHMLGRVYSHMGVYDEAKSLFLRALETRRALYGKTHASIVEVFDDLMRLEYDRGDYQAARRYAQDAINLQNQLSGPDDLAVVRRQTQLSVVLRELGDYAEARALLERAIAVWQQKGQRNDPDYLIAVDALAGIFVEQGVFEQALAMRQEILDLTPTDDPLWPIAANNLARIFSDLGQYQPAKALYTQAVAKNIERFGRLHPRTAQYLHNLAVVYERDAEYEPAAAALTEALDIMQSGGNDQHAGTALVITALSRVLYQQKAYESSLLFALDAIKRQVLHYPKGHHRIAKAHSIAGANLIALIRYEEAESHLLNAYTQFIMSEGDRSGDIKQVLERLIALYSKWGDDSKLEEYRQLLSVVDIKAV